MSFEEVRADWQSTSGQPNWDDAFDRLTDEWRAVEWCSGGTTLLAALGLQYLEVPLCRGLAWLLDPDGGHQLGRHFLNAFMSTLGLVPLADAPVIIRVEETRGATRADIVVRAGDNEIVVEAKVLAGEQSRRADRLHELWPRATRFVFLTRTGEVPRTAKVSADLWHTRTWPQLASLARTTADINNSQPSAGAREFIETIGVL